MNSTDTPTATKKEFLKRLEEVGHVTFHDDGGSCFLECEEGYRFTSGEAITMTYCFPDWNRPEIYGDMLSDSYLGGGVEKCEPCERCGDCDKAWQFTEIIPYADASEKEYVDLFDAAKETSRELKRVEEELADLKEATE